MLHNLTNQAPIPNHRLNLLRHRTLPVIPPLLPGRNINIDTRTLARENLRPQALLAQVERGAVHLVEQDGRQAAQHLQRKLWRLYNVDGGDEAVDDEGDGGGGVYGDGVGLAEDAEGELGAAGDEDGVPDPGLDLDRLAWSVVVFDEPLVAFEDLAGGLLGAHGVGLLAWHGRFAAGGGAVEGVGSCWRNGFLCA